MEDGLSGATGRSVTPIAAMATRGGTECATARPPAAETARPARAWPPRAAPAPPSALQVRLTSCRGLMVASILAAN